MDVRNFGLELLTLLAFVCEAAFAGSWLTSKFPLCGKAIRPTQRCLLRSDCRVFLRPATSASQRHHVETPALRANHAWSLMVSFHFLPSTWNPLLPTSSFQFPLSRRPRNGPWGCKLGYAARSGWMPLQSPFCFVSIEMSRSWPRAVLFMLHSLTAGIIDNSQRCFTAFQSGRYLSVVSECQAFQKKPLFRELSEEISPRLAHLSPRLHRWTHTVSAERLQISPSRSSVVLLAQLAFPKDVFSDGFLRSSSSSTALRGPAMSHSIALIRQLYAVAALHTDSGELHCLQFADIVASTSDYSSSFFAVIQEVWKLWIGFFASIT